MFKFSNYVYECISKKKYNKSATVKSNTINLV